MKPTWLLGPVTGTPLTRTTPFEGASRPAVRFSTVLLPQPEGPTIATNSCGLTAKVMSSIAATSPPPLTGKLRDTLANSRAGVAASMRRAPRSRAQAQWRQDL